MTRLALSVETLGNEILDLSPLTTLYFYDDTAHVDSDHDPNPAGVVCAIDIMAGHGLDLEDLAERLRLRAKQRKDVKYIIYNRRIASRNTGWEWVAYSGKNPHTDHIHLSVGVGPDGYSRPPYDSTERWLDDMGDIFCDKGQKNNAVWSLQQALNRIWKGDPRYDGKNICTENSIYDAATCKAVYTLLSGPADGAHYNPTLHWRLMEKFVQLYGTVPGGEIPPGTTFTSVVVARGDAP